jgi:hypothetical protein
LPPSAKQCISILELYANTFISSAKLPNTLLPITSTVAIGSPKSHCYLLPVIRDLIEATIKGKRQLLLPW